jgi:hypothetical protein
MMLSTKSIARLITTSTIADPTKTAVRFGDFWSRNMLQDATNGEIRGIV